MICTAPHDWTTTSFEAGRQTLKEWRENNSRRSEEIVELWEHVLSRSPSSLGDELWQIYEQVCIAALDISRPELAIECIRRLNERFPRSNRVLKLQAMQYEACEKYDAAAKLYDELIEAEPTNTTFKKRKIALFLTKGQRLEAIKELNEYLKTFINDAEAWVQLSELFLAENDLPKAVHCVESCVIVSPLNSMYHRRLGELRYTMGGQENVELAKAYYEQASKLNASDLRAHYGLVLCANYLATGKNSAEKKKEHVTDGISAADKVIALYDKMSESTKISDLKEAVSQMKISLSK